MHPGVCSVWATCQSLRSKFALEEHEVKKQLNRDEKGELETDPGSKDTKKKTVPNN